MQSKRSRHNVHSQTQAARHMTMLFERCIFSPGCVHCTSEDESPGYHRPKYHERINVIWKHVARMFLSQSRKVLSMFGPFRYVFHVPRRTSRETEFIPPGWEISPLSATGSPIRIPRCSKKSSGKRELEHIEIQSTQFQLSNSGERGKYRAPCLAGIIVDSKKS